MVSTGPKRTLAVRRILKTDLLFLNLHEGWTPSMTSVSIFVLDTVGLFIALNLVLETCYL
jgi:hypothetical protein